MPTRVDAIRAAVILVINNILSAIVLLKVVELDGEQVAIINTTITSIVTLVFLFLPSGGTPSTAQGAKSL